MTPSQMASANIRAEMGRKRITQADLARALDVNEMWLSRRLNDLVPLTLEAITQIAEVLGVSTMDLIGMKATA